MKEFMYKAYGDDGTVIEDRIQAESRKEAAQEIFSRELHLIHLEERKEPFSLPFFGRPFASRQKLALLAEEWASLLDAGLTITDALSLLEDQMEKREKEVLSSIGKTIASGHGVGESFRSARCFPPFFVSLISVGELSGTLPGELHRISRFYWKEDRFLRQLKGALAYPLFVTLFALCLFLVILTFILPSFALLFDSLSIPLPPAASISLKAGLWLKSHGLFLLAFLIFLPSGLFLFFLTEKGKKESHALLYRSRFYRRMLLIRFCSTLAALLESGRTLSASLRDCRDITGNGKARDALSYVITQLEKGEDFPAALEESGFSFPLVCHLCKIGMESGELPRFLRQAGDILSRETERKVRRFRAVLEPSLLLFTGAVTALLVFSVMLPVFRAAGAHMG
ncbi:type II secretion system F family protein [Dialister sp.]|uniref:type II secretion system F family protein n=1 Tax=Dialister sp. TaxID=1955814 RepID=UPI003EFEF336